MKNTFGNNLTLTLFGESHGPAVGAVLDGLCPGIPVEEAAITAQLSRRRPASSLETARREPDRFQIVSGVFHGFTTGTPLCLLIPNEEAKSSDYRYGPARPSHADYAAGVKYHGFEDFRGGGHFSGRLTAALCAAGGILLPMLQKKGILIGTHIRRCRGAEDASFPISEEEVKAAILRLAAADYPVLDPAAGETVIAEIRAATEAGDSVGGVTETAAVGLPAGLGEPVFDSTEGMLSHALYAIGGIKGVAFGLGFGFADLPGSEANDPFRYEDGRTVTLRNHSGGINGGITNGMPLIFSCAVRPTPSIAKPQQSIDFVKKENIELSVRGRHDPAVIRRICPVIDSVTALVLADLLTGRYGCDWFREEI